MLKAFEITGKFNFGVRQCSVQADGDYLKCMVSTRNEVIANAKDYSAIHGAYKRTLGLIHFTFQQNSRNCNIYREKYVYCLFHVVFYRANTSVEDTVKYQVELASTELENILKESSPNRYRQTDS